MLNWKQISNLLFVVAIVAVSGFWSAVLSGSFSAPPTEQSQVKNQPADCSTDQCREVRAQEAVADYTDGLMWVTAFLAVTAAMQGYFLWRANTNSERAFVASKRAFVYVARFNPYWTADHECVVAGLN